MEYLSCTSRRTSDPRTPLATAIAIVVLCALLAACGSLGRGRSAHGEATATIVACRMLFAEVDRTVATEGVRDAQTAGVAGHPYLRVSRFLAATAPTPTDGSAFDAWIERMRELDSRARDIELANLPAEVRAGLVVQTARTHAAPLKAALNKCAATLQAVDLGSETEREELRALAVAQAARDHGIGRHDPDSGVPPQAVALKPPTNADGAPTRGKI